MNKSPEKISHKRRNTIAGVLIGATVIGGIVEGKNILDERNASKTRTTTHFVTDFEELDAKAIAEDMGALDVDKVAKEILEQTGSEITSGERIVIPSNELKPVPRKFDRA